MQFSIFKPYITSCILRHITYGEHGTYTFVQDYYNEHASGNFLFQDQIRTKGQDRDIYNLTTHIFIPHIGKTLSNSHNHQGQRKSIQTYILIRQEHLMFIKDFHS